MNMRFEFNVDDFGEQVDACIDDLIDRMKRGVQDACMMIEADAVKRCPPSSFYPPATDAKPADPERAAKRGTEGEDGGGRDEPPLAKSITTKVDEYRGKVTGLTGSNNTYAIYVHEGTGEEAPLGRHHDLPWTYLGDDGEFYTTRGMKPRPFLQDAFDANRKRADQKIREVIRDG